MKNIEDVYKLSPRQLDLLAGGGGAPAPPLEHVCLSLRDQPDEEALRRAARGAVARHAALRTVVFSGGLKEPAQVVRERAEPTLESRDIGEASAEGLRAALEAFAAEDRRRGVNPSAAPLARFTQLRGRRCGALVLTFHPLILDAASAQRVLRDVLLQCEPDRDDREPERPRPFRDAVAWAEQHRTGAEAHFREALRGAHPAPLPGAAEGPEGAGATAAAPHGAQQIALSTAATANVQALLRSSRVHLATLLESAWAIFLRALGAAPDMLFGALVSGRPAELSRSQAIVGPLAGVLPRRIAVPEGGPIRQLLRGVEAERAGATSYELTSLGQIRSWLGMPPEAALFHSVIGVDPLAQDVAASPPDGRLGVWRAAHLAAGAPWPLTIVAAPGQRLVLRFSHDPRRLGALAVVRLAGAFADFLESVAAEPDRDIGALLRVAPRPAVEPAPARVDGGAIGPAEIEAVLAQHPLVRAASVGPDGRAAAGEGLVARVAIEPSARPGRGRKLAFSLFYFSASSGAGADKYRLYLDAARFADQRGFSAIWTPERHFHEVGGSYPNPSVLSAALATITERVSLRAGSVVLPLHHPLRVAEEWAVVDNLSKGRAAISVANGWVPNDFAFAPGTYAGRRERMFEVLEQVQRLWRGEMLRVEDGVGKPTELRTFPRPVQPELPIWLTAAGNPETFERAGALGHNVLTALLSQPLEDAAQKIALYRAARARAGHDPDAGIVTMSIHAFLGPDPDEVLERVRGPFTAYLRSHVGLAETLVKSLDLQVDLDDPRMRDDIASFAFERYYRTGALMGTPASCIPMLNRLAASGVDEVACIIDFGVGTDDVLAGLHYLDELRRLTHDDAALVEWVLGEHLRERLPGSLPPLAFRLVDGPPG